MTTAEKYQKGVEMKRTGSSGAEIAAALGFANKQGWYDLKYRFESNALTERAAAQSVDNPEPAAILEGLSCAKTADITEKPAIVTVKPPLTPAQSIKADMNRAKARKAAKKQQKPVEEPKQQDTPQAKPAKEEPSQAVSIIADPAKEEPAKEEPATEAPKMLVVQRDFSATGDKLQYRCFEGKIAIKQLGAHGRAITLTRNDIVIMMMELHELIMETST